MEASGTVYYSNQNLMDAAYRLRNLNQDMNPPIPMMIISLGHGMVKYLLDQLKII